MTRKDLARAAAQSCGVQINTSDAVLQAAFDAIADSLARGEPVYIRGFGVFAPVIRAPKKGRLIHSDKTLDIPQRITPVFKPYGELKEKVNQK